MKVGGPLVKNHRSTGASPAVAGGSDDGGVIVHNHRSTGTSPVVASGTHVEHKRCNSSNAVWL
jgi:hypothetical protein